MALTVVETIRAMNPDIGLILNLDGVTYRVGVEDVNSDEILAALNLIRDNPVTTNTTGTGVALATLTPGAAYKLLAARLHISTGAPLAAGETLIITLDCGAGVEYDTVLFSSDLGTPGINDVVAIFGDGYEFVAADSIVIALSANVGGDTWGCQTLHKLI